MFGKLLCLFFPVLFGILIYTYQPKLPIYFSNEPDWKFRFDMQALLDLKALFIPLFELSERYGYWEYYQCINGLYKTLTSIRDFIHADHQSCSSEDLIFDGVHIRIYSPKTQPIAESSLKTGLRPAMFFIHGGGWCIGDTGLYDDLMRTLAQTLGLLTVSVDYRLAPAYPHPAQLDDVTTAFRYFVTHAKRWGVDPERIAVAGDSAGGQLTLTLALRWKRYLAEQQAKSTSGAPNVARLPPIKFIIPIYPVTQAVNLSTRSYNENAHDPMLSRDDMAHFFACYLFGREGCQTMRSQFLAHNFTTAASRAKAAALLALPADLEETLVAKEKKERPDANSDAADEATHPTGDAALESAHMKRLVDEEVSPLFAQNLTGLPPALVITAGYDVLRDDGLAMAKRLREAQATGKESVADGRVGHLHYPQRYHGFFSFSPVELSNGIRDYIKTNKVL